MVKKASEPTLRRLPMYLNLIEHLETKQVNNVSTTYFAEKLKIQSIQVRKDLAVTGVVGRPKLGYEVKELKKSIRVFLGWDNTDNAFLVGAGNLGRALLGYDDFSNLGLSIIAAFDINDELIGKSISNIKILPLANLSSLIKRMHVNIGILTVPEQSAQEVTNIMVQAGIKAIWNFTKVKLVIPENVVVEDVRFSSSLSVLKNRLKQKHEKLYKS